MTRLLLMFMSVALAALCNTPASAQDKRQIEAVLAELGASAVRMVDSDLCYPATSEEYEALGKNAVLMLVSSSAIGTELPLKSAYLELKGVRVPLHRIALGEKQQKIVGEGENSETYTEQTSFYLVPISHVKQGAHLKVDFRGERSGFGVMKFGPIPRDAPGFLRLDAYDSPSEPDMAAVQALLQREYPQIFASR